VIDRRFHIRLTHYELIIILQLLLNIGIVVYLWWLK
jgi:hypothetical protein